MSENKINYAKLEAKDLNIWTYLYQCYALYILFPLTLGWFYKIEYKGREIIEKDKNYILAPNHISYLDVFFASIAFHRPVAYMAKKELFEANWWLRKNMRRLGAFAVNREKPEISTFKTVREVFKTNFSLAIFPQGGIRKGNKLARINKGVAIFAKKSKQDILPIALMGAEKLNWNPFKKQKVNVVVCKPISYELSEEEIISIWCREIAEANNYEICEE